MDGPLGLCTAAIDGPPDHLWHHKRSLWPQMVPLKISLEMMSYSSYEVDLANVDCVIIIFHYGLLYAVARRPSVDTHTARGYN